MELINETVLVTGATSGIGYEMAKLFATNQANMIIVARDEHNLQRVADELRSLGSPTVHTIAKDLSKDGSADEVYETTKREGLKVTILVNDAGVGEHGYFSETDLEK